MIKKNDEIKKIEPKINSFKKFSEISKTSKVNSPNEDSSMTQIPLSNSDLPGNPNLPNQKSKIPQKMSTKELMPNKNVEKSVERKVNENNDIKFFGKVAKLPKGIRASKGFNFLENVKVSKSSIWYIMVEKQDNELQMVKYNHKKGVDLSKFVNDLKLFYKEKYQKNEKLVQLVESIEIDGNDKFSWIKNIPHVEIDGKKMLSKITEDLIKLLSK